MFVVGSLLILSQPKNRRETLFVFVCFQREKESLIVLLVPKQMFNTLD